MTKAQFQSDVEAAGRRYEDEIDRLARIVRKTVVKPLCKKNCLEFTSGMGSFSFHLTRPVSIPDPAYPDDPVVVKPGSLRAVISDADDATRLGFDAAAFKEAFDVLNLDLYGGRFNLGHYVTDVRQPK